MKKTGENFEMGISVYRTYRDKLNEIADELKVLKKLLHQEKIVEELTKKIADNYKTLKKYVNGSNTEMFDKEMQIIDEDTEKLNDIVKMQPKSQNQIKTEVMGYWRKFLEIISNYHDECQDEECTSNFILSMQLYVLEIFGEFISIVPEISETIEDQKRRILEF